MGKCRGCYLQYPDQMLGRDGYCEQCDKQRAKGLREESRRNSRKSCSRCGDHGLFLYLDSDGLCDNCRPKVEAERKEKRRQEALRSNYEILKAGKAEPDLQRTYDAFHRKYPNALVTGVQVTGDSARINIHLAGGYLYHVRFNPLTNDVDVSKVSDSNLGHSSFPGVQPSSSSAKDSNKSYGLAIFISVLALLYNIFILLFSYLGGFVGIISSVVALFGGIAKSKSAIVFGACFLILSAIFAFPYSILNFIFLILLIASS